MQGHVWVWHPFRALPPRASGRCACGALREGGVLHARPGCGVGAACADSRHARRASATTGPSDSRWLSQHPMPTLSVPSLCATSHRPGSTITPVRPPRLSPPRPRSLPHSRIKLTSSASLALRAWIRASRSRSNALMSAIGPWAGWLRARAGTQHAAGRHDPHWQRPCPRGRAPGLCGRGRWASAGWLPALLLARQGWSRGRWRRVGPQVYALVRSKPQPQPRSPLRRGRGLWCRDFNPENVFKVTMTTRDRTAAASRCPPALQWAPQAQIHQRRALCFLQFAQFWRPFQKP